MEGVISVGAYDRFLTPWSNSSIGSNLDPYNQLDRVWPNQKPEILAPGSYILSTVSSQKSPPYAYSTGTSDAAIFVTATLALILQDLTEKGLIDLTIEGVYSMSRRPLRRVLDQLKTRWGMIFDRGMAC